MVEMERRENKKGKNSLPQLADPGNPTISQQPESRGRWAVSLKSFIRSLPIHLSAFLSLCSHSPDELATIFLLLSPLLLCSHSRCFVLSLPFVLKLLLFQPSLFLSLDVRNCLTTAQARLQPPVGSFHISRSDANHSASKWCYSQHADSTWYSAGPD